MMTDDTNYRMAIDMLCCHLGLTEDEAKEQLGLAGNGIPGDRFTEAQTALMGLSQEQ